MFGSDDDQEAARKRRLEEEQKKNEEDRQRKKEEKKEAEIKKAKQDEAWAELRKELDAATDPLSLGGASAAATDGSLGKKEAAPYQPPLIRPFGGPTVGPPRPVITSQNRPAYQPGNSSQSTKSNTTSTPQTTFTGSTLKRPY